MGLSTGFARLSSGDLLQGFYIQNQLKILEIWLEKEAGSGGGAGCFSIGMWRCRQVRLDETAPDTTRGMSGEKVGISTARDTYILVLSSDAQRASQPSTQQSKHAEKAKLCR